MHKPGSKGINQKMHKPGKWDHTDKDKCRNDMDFHHDR